MASLRPTAGRLGMYVSLEAHRGYVLVAMVLNVDRTPIPGGAPLPLAPLA